MVLTMLASKGYTMSDESNPESLRQQVERTEQAFAATMAERDFEAFKTFLDENAIFFSGEKPLRGAEQVALAWESFFQDEAAPFSWTPDTVEVLATGDLALSSGPVYDPQGKLVGRFNSIWRRQSSGEWRVVFDKGSDACP
ncbi:nuclear transport factor 2 family protein [Seongchinamella unica]|uniref:Nuclear transport factor 2 family protein n=2 Tax=Seongchinamella unica TaxID=2547392 RepID=A0A4R5LMX3_9GAMM|nr:nuclear transport factor 2 family protein [Seongchinamella unica]